MSSNSIGITKMSRARRLAVLNLLKKHIPAAAEQRREQIRKNARYCKLCIIDAFNGRLSNGLANNSPEFNPSKTAWEYNLFCLNTSEYVYNAGMSYYIFASDVAVTNTNTNSQC